MTIQDEFQYFIEHCTKSPSSFRNYHGGFPYIDERLSVHNDGFTSIYDYTDPKNIQDFINLLGEDIEYTQQDEIGKKMYSNALKSYLNFVEARSFFKTVSDKNDKPSYISTDSLQQIFYGAPGTGKSHGVKEETKEWEKQGRVVRTTFHPDSDYSTFVGTYKPTTQQAPRYDMYQNPIKDKQTGLPVMEQIITYEFVPQAFLQAYVDAWKERDEREYLVIEEINRGNCAQIFGDLFQLLDRGDDGFSEYAIRADRDLQKFLASAFADADIEDVNIKEGKVLKLPSNLFIRATMNTSDQSLFPIDSAFKRRWDWQYMPISNAGKNWYISAQNNNYDWWDFVEKINKHILDATKSEDKQLGYFFCKAKDKYINTETFVGKVIFYLWNDVFKDFGFDDAIFNDKDDEVNPKLSFDKFYDPNGKAKAETVKKFMENLGVVAITAAEETEEYDGQEESVDSPDTDKKNWRETQEKRYEFWEEFFNYAQNDSEFQKHFGGTKTPTKEHWKNFSIKGVDFKLVVLQQRQKKAIEVEVYFDETEKGYHDLFAHKDEIEQEMQVQYEWRELPDKKASSISEIKTGVNYDNKAEWPELFDFCIDRLLRMREVFPKYAK